MSSPTFSEIFERYLDVYPHEIAHLERLASQLGAGDALQDRSQMRGHLTASVLVLSPDRTKALLIWHAFSGRLLQVGGHMEKDDSTPLECALRELEEEIGLKDLQFLPLIADHPEVPYSINLHAIGVNTKKQEGTHVHHDCVYIAIAQSDELPHSREIGAISDPSWYALEEMLQMGETFRRIILRLQERGDIPPLLATLDRREARATLLLNVLSVVGMVGLWLLFGASFDTFARVEYVYLSGITACAYVLWLMQVRTNFTAKRIAFLQKITTV